MKLLVLSDITWGLHAANPPGQVAQFLRRIVSFADPDAVLLAGDLVDDKLGPRDAYLDALSRFLHFLRRRRAAVLAVQGNWDDPRTYEEMAGSAAFTDISEHLVNYGPLSILGVSHEATQDIAFMRRMADGIHKPIDIVLAHCEFRRRPWLLLLNTRLVITGHFDTRLSLIHGKALLSMWDSPGSYALIQTHHQGWRVNLYVARPSYMPHARMRENGPAQAESLPLVASASLYRGRLSCEPQSPVFADLAYRPNYTAEVEALINARQSIRDGLSTRIAEESSLNALGVPRKHVAEFLACT